jgi:phenylalanine-4-hydroxylase
MTFSAEQNKVWKTLFKRQEGILKQHACREYVEGFKKLAMPTDHIPSVEELNEKITPATGWAIKRTSIRYSDPVSWYEHMARKELLITDYVRSMEELDFTPEPDVFHDTLGHTPFLMIPEYTQLLELFAPAFFHAKNEKERENIKRLTWFSYEFGLIKENGKIKIFGAGLLSSFGEINHVVAGKTPIEPFTVDNVLKLDKANWSFNKKLFVFDSIKALTKELSTYFDTVGT